MDWNPGDKTLFFASIAQDLQDAAKTAYAKRVSDLLGKDLKPGLSWDQFVAEPVIQSRWSKALGVPGEALSPEFDLNQFRETVYSAMVDRAALPIITLLSDPDRDPGDTIAALEWHFVPALAFCSALLLVAAVGVVAVWDVLALAGLSRSVRAQVAAGAIVAACFGWFGPWVVDPSVRAGAGTIPLPAPLTVMAVEAAPIFHAAGDSVRRHVLGGFGFGFGDVRSRDTDIGITETRPSVEPRLTRSRNAGRARPPFHAIHGPQLNHLRRGREGRLAGKHWSGPVRVVGRRGAQQHLDLANECRPLERLAEHRNPSPHLLKPLRVIVAGDQQGGQAGPQPDGFLNQLAAGHTRHRLIGHQQVAPLARAQQVQSGRPAVRGENTETGLAQEHRQGTPHDLLVIDHQHAGAPVVTCMPLSGPETAS